MIFPSQHFYQNYILKAAPVLLTQVDRDRDSLTYGSCDRNFWHLKIRDFSSAILQQAGLSIALLYTLPFEGNIYYKNENMKEWAASTMYFWRKIQLGDGSFNEYYPNEHGFPPTAFSLFAVCETYKLLGYNDHALEKNFEKTAWYLINNIEHYALNQEIGSIAAIYSAYSILKMPGLLFGLDKKIKILLERQSAEGWFSEYGGADIGYLSVSYDFLAEYYYQSKDERVLRSLEQLTEFIQYFIHPDGTIGGTYASRNTTYLLPNGLEVMSLLQNKTAVACKQFLYFPTNKFMDSVDDRYNSHYVVHSFLRALQKLSSGTVSLQIDSKMPFELYKKKFFSESGLLFYSSKNYTAIVGGKKGGVLKIFKGNKEIFLDTGYRAKIGKKIAITNWQDDNYKLDFTDNELRINGELTIIKLQVGSPFKHFVLRIISFLFGKKIIILLKRLIILNNKHLKGSLFTRRIQFHSDNIIVEDVISFADPVTLFEASNFSLRHVASGKLFQTSDLINFAEKKWEGHSNFNITKKYDIINERVL